MMLFRRTLSATCNSVDLSMSVVALLYNYRCQSLHTSFWKHHIDTVSLKIRKTVGLLAKLRHFVPRQILLKIYQSLIYPYITYGLAAWGQAAKTHLNKILLLQKRALRIINFSDRRDHVIPLFIDANVLPLNFLYYQILCMLSITVRYLLAF